MINTRSVHTYAMRIAPFLLTLLVIPLAQAYGILISGKDLNVVDANAYADYVIGRTALCIGTDCRTTWPAGISTILGVSPIVVSGTGDTRTIELNYDTTRGLAVENNQLYVLIGTGLSYSPTGAIRVLYGSTGGTAVEGNTTLTITAGTGLSGGGTVTLGSGGSVELGIANPAISCESGALSGFDLSNGTPTCIPVDENGLDDVVDTDLNVFGGYIWHIRRGTTWYPLGASDVNCADCVALGTETTGQYVEGINAGTGISVTPSGTEALTVTIAHADTSSAASTANTGGVVVQNIGIDQFGHVTSIGSVDLDPRFVNVGGDWMTGTLGFNVDATTAIGLRWKWSNDFARIYEENLSTTQSRLVVEVGDDMTDYIALVHTLWNGTPPQKEVMRVWRDKVEVNGQLYVEGNVYESGVPLEEKYVPSNRLVSTLAPLTGGGPLSSDLTLGLNIGTGLTVNNGALEMNVTSDISCRAGEVLTLVNPATGAHTCVAVDTNPGDDITGSGTSPYLPYWTGSQSLGTTNIYYDSAHGWVGIGTTTPSERLHVDGNIYASKYLKAGTGICIGSECHTSLGVTDVTGTAPIRVTGTSTKNVALDYNGDYFTLDAASKLALATAYATGSAYDARFVNEGQENSITSTMIVDGTISTEDIADGAITSAKIADATITNADIASTTKYVSVQDSSGTEKFAVTNGSPALRIAEGAGISVSFNSSTHTITITNTGDTNPSDDVIGSGTANYIPKWTDATTLGNSQIYDDGTNVGIGTTNPSYTLDVAGTGRFIGTDRILTLSDNGSGGTPRLYIEMTKSGSAAPGIELKNVDTSTTSTIGWIARDGTIVTFEYPLGTRQAAIDTSGNMYARTFRDQDDSSYLVDPAGTSKLNALNVNTINGVPASSYVRSCETVSDTDPTSLSCPAGKDMVSVTYDATNGWVATCCVTS